MIGVKSVKTGNYINATVVENRLVEFSVELYH